MRKLSISQVHAVSAYTTWLQGTEKYFHLKGGAGRGKSWVYANHLHLLTANSSNNVGPYSVLATTHQACDSFNRVFESVKQPNISECVAAGLPLVVRPTVTTLHSSLGLVPNKEPRNAKFITDAIKNFPYQVNRIADNPDMDKQIFVIDEAYRIDKPLMEYMNLVYPSARFVFIYDPYQTKAISDNRWTIEDLPDSVHVTLVEAKRFKDNSRLTTLVDDLLLCVQYQEDNYMDVIPDVSEDNVKKITPSAMKAVLAEMVSSAKPVDYGNTLLLSATRKRADSYNTHIMKARAKLNMPALYKNESVVVEYVIGRDHSLSDFRRMVSADRDLTQTRHEQAVKYLADVIGLDSANILNKDTITRLVPVYINYNTQKTTIVFLLSGDGGMGLSPFALRELWGISGRQDVNFVFIRANLCKTIHMAQGITSKNVYLDTVSLAKWESDDDKRRLYYTGASRASDTLYLIKD